MTTVVDRIAGIGEAALDRLEKRFTPTSAIAAFFFLNAQVALLATYVLVGRSRIVDWVPMLVPFVWINVSIAAVAWTDVRPANRRHRLVGIAVGVGYFAILAVVGGLVGFGSADLPTTFDVVIADIPPGWAPALLANTPTVRVSILFYELVGYLALAYLVYATVVDAAGSAVAGVVGLLSCVSCTWPVIGTIVTSVFGGSTAIAAVAQDWTYALSTLIFLVTVALLYWRPGIGTLRSGSTD